MPVPAADPPLSVVLMSTTLASTAAAIAGTPVPVALGPEPALGAEGVGTAGIVGAGAVDGVRGVKGRVVTGPAPPSVGLEPWSCDRLPIAAPIARPATVAATARATPRLAGAGWAAGTHAGPGTGGHGGRGATTHSGGGGPASGTSRSSVLLIEE
jgi:hypothetical protein